MCGLSCIYVHKNYDLNFRIPGHFFTYHWIRKVPIVLYLVLYSVPTNVNDVAGYSEVAPNHAIVEIHLACEAWQFWLGAQTSQGGQGQWNCEEIGAEAPPTQTPFTGVRIVLIGLECTPIYQIFGNLPWESSKWLSKFSPLNKITISKKNWLEHCQSWIFDGKTG